jgi:hypothetical protein
MRKSPTEQPHGCTVGVIRLAGGMLFFKNRDLQGKHLRNRTTVFHSTPETHALKGVNLETGELEGVSIGVNRNRVCVANTHIASTPDVTYDVLCERLLRQARDRNDVPKIVAAFLHHSAVQGGRILVASPQWGYLIEVLGKTHRFKTLDANFVMTNHFSLLPHETNWSETRSKSSKSRLETANNALDDITRIGALKSLLRSHAPEKGELSVCNHRQDGGGTESSHIIQIQGAYVGWSSLSGFPCEGDYHTLQLFQE